jgi:transposase
MGRSMSKSELAAEFGVHRATMMLWIKHNPKLFDQLKKMGYKSTQKLFTPKQIELIQSFFS